MILVSFSSDDNVLYDEIKICYIFEYQSNENRAFPFLGDTWYKSHVGQLTRNGVGSDYISRGSYGVYVASYWVFVALRSARGNLPVNVTLRERH